MRTFVIVGLAVLGVAAAGVLYVSLGGGGDGERRTGALRSFTVGGWHLEIGGVAAGQLRSVEGCGVEASVALVTQTDKRPGPGRLADCQITFTGGLGLPGWQWINDATLGSAARNAALTHVDGSGVADFQLNLTSARLVRFQLPKLDSASNEAVIFRADLAADRVDRVKTIVTPKAMTTTKSLLAANFRLTIPGLDTTKVAAVESWSFEVASTSGIEKPPPAKLGDLTILTSETSSAGFEDWLRKSLISGEQLPEKTAKLELLTADLKSAILTVDFTGVGIIGGELFGASESSTDTPKREFSFYVEGATLKYAG